MFLDELAENLQVNLVHSFLGCFLGFNGIELQGKVRVEFYSTVKLVLRFGKQQVFVYGQNLKIKNLDMGEIVVVGEIFCVSSREVQIV